MLKAEQIPDTCEWHAIATSCVEGATWKDIIAAAINSWPGAEWRESGHYPNGTSGPDATVTKRVILPLPQEASDD